MRPTLTVLVAGVALLVTAGCGGGKSPADAPPASAGGQFPAPATAVLPADKATALQKVLDDVIARFEASPDDTTAGRGLTAAVVTDRWTWTGAAGVDGVGRKLEPRTEVALASITKTFVGAEVLKLADEGKVDLDKPISTYVKHKLTQNGATVRQHLAMRSGVPNYTPADYGAMDKIFTAEPGRRWTPQDVLSHHSAAVTDPGGTYDYSNPSYVLLGLLIEGVTHQPLATVVRRDLVEPAGLSRIAFQDAERPQPPVAYTRTPICPGLPDGYLPCRSVASASMANAGMAADAATTALWGYQLYGARAVPAKTVTEMTAGDGEYGLATMRFSSTLGPDEAFGHRGETPGCTTILAVVPQRKVSMAILMTEDRHDLTEVTTALLAAVQAAG